MSKHKIRENKICQNCGRFVDKNFCPSCGQENSEVRHSFIYLVKHFIADLLHYDSSLWTTAKLLLFSPAALSKEYLAGKRKAYVDPIKLYIFISFLAFFIPSVLPEKHSDKEPDKFSVAFDEASADSTLFANLGDSIMYENKTYTVATFDSAYQAHALSFTEYYAVKAINKNKDVFNDKERQDKISEFIVHNLPKVLFIYMPIFAFWLWFFNNKKKFLYFDSAIFTLHYFSFLLLMITILNIVNTALDWMNVSSVWGYLLSSATFLYAFFYFFRAHRLFYGQKRWIANIKACIIIWIDIVFISVILVLFAVFAAVWV